LGKDLWRGRGERRCFFALATANANRGNEDGRKNELWEFHKQVGGLASVFYQLSG
jgi:hypothetical protein